MVIRANLAFVLPEFLPFLMMSDRFMNRAVEISVGSLSPTINWNTLKLEEFDLPPLDQQRRIADILWAIDTLILNTENLANNLRNARKTFFATTIKEGLRSVARGEQTTWPHWQEVLLADVAEFLDGKRQPIKEADRSKRRGKYPYYGASGIIDTIDDFLFDELLVLLSEDGANIVDRKSPLAFRVSGKIWVNNHAHVLRIKHPNSTVYIEYYLESLDYKPFITGTAQPKLNKSICEGIIVPLPNGELQQQIEQQLIAFEDILRFNIESEQYLKKLFSVLVNQLV
jgi:type I restriction enzyme S subunit